MNKLFTDYLKVLAAKMYKDKCVHIFKAVSLFVQNLCIRETLNKIFSAMQFIKSQVYLNTAV